MNMKRLLSSLLVAALALSLCACRPAAPDPTPDPTPSAAPSASPSAQPSGDVTPTPTPAASASVELAVLKGNTGMSAAKLLADNDAGTTLNSYSVTLATDPSEVTAKLINGDIDIAALPTNVAATLFNKTSGGVQILALCGLGVLYLLENGESVQSFSDLRGQTVYAPANAQGANPEYVFNHLLRQHGLEPGQDVTIEWLDADTLSAQMASGEVKLAMMPVPAATAVTLKNPDVRFALDFTAEWDALHSDSKLAMSCVVARTAFIQEQPQAVAAFLQEYEASIEYIRAGSEDAAALVAQYGITPSAKVAAAAIPQVNLVFLTGSDVREVVDGYLDVLWNADSASIGGFIPDDSFYYVP